MHIQRQLRGAFHVSDSKGVLRAGSSIVDMRHGSDGEGIEASQLVVFGCSQKWSRSSSSLMQGLHGGFTEGEVRLRHSHGRRVGGGRREGGVHGFADGFLDRLAQLLTFLTFWTSGTRMDWDGAHQHWRVRAVGEMADVGISWPAILVD